MTSRSRAVGFILLGVVFGAGVATGVVIDRWMIPRKVVHARLVGDMSRVLDSLSLTPEQRMHAERIVERSAPRTEAAMLEVGERLQTVADSVDAELRAILTPEQRTRLDALRRRPTIMLKRKVKEPGGRTSVDTVYPRRP
jgi:hypothetical protein